MCRPTSDPIADPSLLCVYCVTKRPSHPIHLADLSSARTFVPLLRACTTMTVINIKTTAEFKEHIDKGGPVRFLSPQHFKDLKQLAACSVKVASRLEHIHLGLSYGSADRDCSAVGVTLHMLGLCGAWARCEYWPWVCASALIASALP